MVPTSEESPVFALLSACRLHCCFRRFFNEPWQPGFAARCRLPRKAVESIACRILSDPVTVRSSAGFLWVSGVSESGGFEFAHGAGHGALSLGNGTNHGNVSHVAFGQPAEESGQRLTACASCAADLNRLEDRALAARGGPAIDARNVRFLTATSAAEESPLPRVTKSTSHRLGQSACRQLRVMVQLANTRHYPRCDTKLLGESPGRSEIAVLPIPADAVAYRRETNEF